MSKFYVVLSLTILLAACSEEPEPQTLQHRPTTSTTIEENEIPATDPKQKESELHKLARELGAENKKYRSNLGAK